MPRIALSGSPPRSLNADDWWNVGKHVLLVAGASGLAALAEQIPGLLTELGMPVLVPVVTGLLMLGMRWLQDNRR